MKANQSSGLNHTMGRRGPLALHDYLRCATEQAGRRQAGSSPPAGSLCCLQAPGTCYGSSGSGRPGVQQQQHKPIPGAVGSGERGLAPSSASLLPRLQKSSYGGGEGRGRPEKSSSTSWPGCRERGSRQEVALAPGQTPPCQPLPWPGKQPQGSRKPEPQGV